MYFHFLMIILFTPADHEYVYSSPTSGSQMKYRKLLVQFQPDVVVSENKGSLSSFIQSLAVKRSTNLINYFVSSPETGGRIGRNRDKYRKRKTDKQRE